MSTKPITRSRCYWWRLALLLLVLLPLLPELVIYAVTALAKAGGCLVNDDWVCLIAGVRVADILAKMLKLGISVARYMGEYKAAIVWLGFCYLAITFGWRRLASRLSLGLVVTIFALALYFGPEKSIRDLGSNNCPLSGGGAVKCMIFGVDIADSTRGTVADPNVATLGALMAVGAFVIYLIVTIVIWFCAASYQLTKRRDGLNGPASQT
jgi:hypothetical protein